MPKDLAQLILDLSSHKHQFPVVGSHPETYGHDGHSSTDTTEVVLDRKHVLNPDSEVIEAAKAELAGNQQAFSSLVEALDYAQFYKANGGKRCYPAVGFSLGDPVTKVCVFTTSIGSENIKKALLLAGEPARPYLRGGLQSDNYIIYCGSVACLYKLGEEGMLDIVERILKGQADELPHKPTAWALADDCLSQDLAAIGEPLDLPMLVSIATNQSNRNPGRAIRPILEIAQRDPEQSAQHLRGSYHQLLTSGFYQERLIQLGAQFLTTKDTRAVEVLERYASYWETLRDYWRISRQYPKGAGYVWNRRNLAKRALKHIKRR